VSLTAGEPTAVPANTYVADVDVTLTPHVAPALGLSALVPPTLPTGSANALIRVQGSGFTPASRIYWSSKQGALGGEPASGTSYVSATELTMRTAAGGLTTVGPRYVTVVDGGARSNTLTFLVTEEPLPPQEETTYNGGYPYVETLYARLAALAEAYPELRALTYGMSHAKAVGGVTIPNGDRCLGYDLVQYQLGDPTHPTLYCRWGDHADEIDQSPLGYEWLVWLLTTGEGRRVWETRHIVNVIVPNPDGLWLVQNGPRHGLAPYFCRKNLDFSAMPVGATWDLGGVLGEGEDRDWSMSGLRPNRERYPGVNLNRVWGKYWGEPSTYASSDWSSRNFWGTGPMAAIEVDASAAAIREIAEQAPQGLALNFHGSPVGRAVGYPWGGTLNPHPREPYYAALAGRLAALVDCDSAQISKAEISTVPAPRPGCVDDWITWETRFSALLVEVNGDTIQPPYARVAENLDRYRPLLVEAARLAGA
jgi:hypothetical protein